MAVRLTIKQVENFQPSTVRIEIPDALAPGLHLVVQPSGIKSWAFRYRTRGDLKPKKYTIGRFPDYSLAEAREEALELARSARRGGDPAKDKIIARARANDRTDTIDAQLDDFMEKYVTPTNKDRTAEETKRIFDREVRPVWGDRKVAAITKGDVISLLEGMTDRGVTTHANRVFSRIRKFFNWQISKNRLVVSPCQGLRQPVEEMSRERVLSGDEIRWLWLATDDASKFDRCVRVLLLSAQRRMEIGGLCLSEIVENDGSPRIVLPSIRTKNGLEHLVPLTPAMKFELDELVSQKRKVKADEVDRELVFNLKTSSGWTKLKSDLDRRMLAMAQAEAEALGVDPASVSIPNWTIHDLRRTAATRLAQLKVEPHVIEALMNHISGKISGVARVYNRYEYYDEKADALKLWEAFVIRHCEGPVSGYEDEAA